MKSCGICTLRSDVLTALEVHKFYGKNSLGRPNTQRDMVTYAAANFQISVSTGQIDRHMRNCISEQRHVQLIALALEKGYSVDTSDINEAHMKLQLLQQCDEAINSAHHMYSMAHEEILRHSEAERRTRGATSDSTVRVLGTEWVQLWTSAMKQTHSFLELKNRILSINTSLGGNKEEAVTFLTALQGMLSGGEPPDTRTEGEKLVALMEDGEI